MRIKGLKIVYIIVLLISCYSCDKKDQNGNNTSILQLMKVKVGSVTLDISGETGNLPIDGAISLEFSAPLDKSSVDNSISLLREGTDVIPFLTKYINDDKTLTIQPESNLVYNSRHSLQIGSALKGTKDEIFTGCTVNFRTENGKLNIESIEINDIPFDGSKPVKNVNYEQVLVRVVFSDSLNPDNYQSNFSLSGGKTLSFQLSDDKKSVLAYTTVSLDDYTHYDFNISNNLISANGYEFGGFAGRFYTMLDSTYKYPILTEEELLTLTQQQTFKYFWDLAHPVSGMARDRNTSGDIVTSGGTGFGLMAIIVGIERGFITRAEGISRFSTILTFLENCDRYHGAWAHWINGSTGKTIPFSTKDDGGDLVETAFLIQGLLTFRQYLNENDVTENDLISQINDLWNSVEWNWYTKNDEDVLYWHWSPNYNWEMNFQLRGYNETIITYALASSSTSYTIDKPVYDNGWAMNGSIINGKTFYGITLPMGYDYGGPLFFSHYSFLGLDPRKLSDTYGNYWEQGVAHSMINYSYCVANPLDYLGYSTDCWGLTASDNNEGYGAHSPTNDLGVISPTAALSSMPYSPEQSIKALNHFYYLLGDKLWGDYGFYDAFNATEGWWANSYLAIDQGPIIIMIENYRTGLLWNLFMSCPEIQDGLLKLGFTYE